LIEGRVREKRGNCNYERKGSLEERLLQQEKKRRNQEEEKNNIIKPSLELLKTRGIRNIISLTGYYLMISG
jgi:DUF2075 family protein